MQYINKKNEMSKKIGILLVESLPLPPVKGGAVENLTQLIIDNNEDRHDLISMCFQNMMVLRQLRQSNIIIPNINIAIRQESTF